MELLILLVEQRGAVLSKEQVLQALWPDSFVEEANISQNIFVVRKALGENGRENLYIATIAGRGYRFIGDVREIASSEELRPLAEASHSPESTGRKPDLEEPRVGRGKVVWAAASVVIIAAALVLSWPSRHARQPIHPERTMIAILPFSNFTGQANEDYFSDGLTEEMITQLGRLDPKRVGVIARTSVMRYKDTRLPVRDIGAELGVDYVLEGSVRRQAGKVRISAQLIQCSDQTHLWAREYDGELNDLLAVQGQISQEIGEGISQAFGWHPPKASPARPAMSSQQYQAYDLYLKSQYLFARRNASDLQRAIGYLQQAIAHDPNDARSYAALADCYMLISGYSGIPQSQFVDRARVAARRALGLDEQLPEAHTAMALVLQNYDWNWPAAEREFTRAIDLNPNYATAHHWYAEHLMWRGRFAEALAESEKARQIDPLSLIIAADNGAILFYSRQYDRAIEKWRTVQEMEPSFPRAYLIRAAYLEKGMFSEAMKATQAARSDPPASNQSWRSYIYARSGQIANAKHALDQLLELNRRQALDPLLIFRAYVGLGDKDLAITWLEKAFAQRSSELVALKVSPEYDSLRGEPRFADLLRRVGLEH